MKMDDLPPFEVDEQDFDFLNDKYWLLRPVLEERGIQLDAEDDGDEGGDVLESAGIHSRWLNTSLNGFQNAGSEGPGGTAAAADENGERWHLLKRLNELKMLEKVENRNIHGNSNGFANATITNHNGRLVTINSHPSRTVSRPRLSLARADFAFLNDVNTRTFTRPKRSPVSAGRNFPSTFNADDLMNISEVDIEADLTRILSTPRNLMNGNCHRLSLDSLSNESQLKNNQSFIIGKREHRLLQPCDQATPEIDCDKLNTTFVNEIIVNGGGEDFSPSSSFANNYNDVQEIARKQEEVLKKKSNLLRNNTIVKSKRERTDMEIDKPNNAQPEIDAINTSIDDFNKIDLNSTFCKEGMNSFVLTPESVLSIVSPGI